MMDMEAAPLDLYADVVRPEWIDYNGHLSEAYYVLVFGFATTALLDYVGMDGAYRTSTGCTAYTVEAHINYLRELKLDAPLRVTTQLLAFDKKRLHLFHRLYHAEAAYLAATTELMLIHVDQGQQRSAAMPPEIRQRVEELYNLHAGLPRPPQAGRSIRLG